MGQHTTETDEKHLSTHSCPLHCKDIWSRMQSYSYMQVSTRYTDLGIIKRQFANKHTYLLPAEDDNLTLRAGRIAGTYARLYLELATIAGNGAPSKKGRFYWMALGAFAGKTVKCTLDQISTITANAADGATFRKKGIRTAMGKGNLWLFLDMVPWHLFFIHHRDCFDQCLNSRAVPNNLNEQIQDAIYRIAWAEEALPKMKEMRVTNEVVKAFALSAKFEITNDEDSKRKIQLEHLTTMVAHEQHNILQGLIYEGPENADFTKWLWMQRKIVQVKDVVKYTSPLLFLVDLSMSLVFSRECSIKDPKLKSVAPKNTDLEIYDSRLAWMNSAVDKFHRLMGSRTTYMEQEILAIANWWTPE